ncbi:hypothetical protein LguiA_009483 [Lonicera macranthoides]
MLAQDFHLLIRSSHTTIVWKQSLGRRRPKQVEADKVISMLYKEFHGDEADDISIIPRNAYDTLSNARNATTPEKVQDHDPNATPSDTTRPLTKEKGPSYSGSYFSSGDLTSASNNRVFWIISASYDRSSSNTSVPYNRVHEHAEEALNLFQELGKQRVGTW